MKPYYKHAGITIYHGDCREILPQLAQVDLILTDPPYGVAWKSSSAQLAMREIAGDGRGESALDALALACSVLRRKRHVYAFGKWDFRAIGMDGVCELVWDKVILGRPLSDPWMSQHEPITFAVKVASDSNVDSRGEGNAPARLRRGNVLRYERMNGDAINRHPTEKPLALLRELIECSSKFGELVLDPFMGSGSTIEASKIEGRRAIGIEIEEKYCEIAAKRLSQEVLDFTEPATSKQEVLGRDPGAPLFGE